MLVFFWGKYDLFYEANTYAGFAHFLTVCESEAVV